MELKPLKQNMTELILESGTRVLFSYRTPVASWRDGFGFRITEKRWSNTTSRHINKWTGGNPHDKMPQEYFNDLVMEVA